jgi:uncharacterized membrane protein YbhN (UPF0104 family)
MALRQAVTFAPNNGGMLKKLPSWLTLVLKIGISAICLWYVSRKINWLETWKLLEDSNKAWLIVAAIFFISSKIVSSFRLNIYFRNIALPLSEKNSLKLYWLGMFYNLFLPGGIGGDAYKVILLNKKGKINSYKLTTAAVLLDRISGVAGLGILAAIFYFLLYRGTVFSWLAIAAIIPGIAAYWFIVKKWFPSFVAGFMGTLILGLLVQILQVICVYFLMLSIGIHQHFNAFQFIFLLSSIVAILPFTIGGLGAREIVFLWGATEFGLVNQEAVYISLLFYFITVLTSLVGLIWVYRDPIASEK